MGVLSGILKSGQSSTLKSLLLAMFVATGGLRFSPVGARTPSTSEGVVKPIPVSLQPTSSGFNSVTTENLKLGRLQIVSDNKSDIKKESTGANSEEPSPQAEPVASVHPIATQSPVHPIATQSPVHPIATKSSVTEDRRGALHAPIEPQSPVTEDRRGALHAPIEPQSPVTEDQNSTPAAAVPSTAVVPATTETSSAPATPASPTAVVPAETSSTPATSASPSTPGTPVSATTSAQLVPNAETADGTKRADQPQSRRRLQMRLSGSMCIACLKDLEDALKKLPGVERTHIAKPFATFTQSVSPDVNNWAQSIIVYDQNRINFETIRSHIRQAGYHAYHMTEKELDHAPEERDMKF